MTCKNCGTELLNESNFCANCGITLNEKAEAFENKFEGFTENAYDNIILEEISEKPKKKSGLIFRVIVLLVRLSGLVIGLNNFITTPKETAKNLESLRFELETIRRNKVSAEIQYSDISNRIEELYEWENNSSVSDYQMEELQELKEQSRDLDNQIWLLKQKEEITEDKVSEAEQDVLNNRVIFGFN